MNQSISKFLEDLMSQGWSVDEAAEAITESLNGILQKQAEEKAKAAEEAKAARFQAMRRNEFRDIIVSIEDFLVKWHLVPDTYTRMDQENVTDEEIDSMLNFVSRDMSTFLALADALPTKEELEEAFGLLKEDPFAESSSKEGCKCDLGCCDDDECWTKSEGNIADPLFYDTDMEEEKVDDISAEDIDKKDNFFKIKISPNFGDAFINALNKFLK